MAVGAARRGPLGLGSLSHKKENKLQGKEKNKSTAAVGSEQSRKLESLQV